jgi:hypothetical protein
MIPVLGFSDNLSFVPTFKSSNAQKLNFSTFELLNQGNSEKENRIVNLNGNF